MQIPTYPNISWIHQLVSAGFRYPEYEPNVEHFLEVLEPFFSITVEEAGACSRPHGFGSYVVAAPGAVTERFWKPL
jgi:hypothetical protein